MAAAIAIRLDDLHLADAGDVSGTGGTGGTGGTSSASSRKPDGMDGGGPNGFGPSDAARLHALRAASTLPTSAQVIERICSDLPAFHGMWDRLRQMAIGHMRANPPAQAILDDYKRMLDCHLPHLLRRTIAWRSSKTDRVVLIKFTGVRYVLPDNMRSTNIGRERFKDGLTAFERAQQRRWAYCLYVMVNVETTTINCDPKLDLTQALELLPDEHGDITPEQEALLRARARVQRNKALEAPLVKIPMPRGAEAADDPERIPATDPRAGEYFVNKSINVHAINVPVTNRAIPIVVAKKTKPTLVVKVYSHADGTYRSTATMSFHTEYNPNSVPHVTVKLAYPRLQTVSLFECFMMLHVSKVGWILRLAWPNGVPPAERLAYLNTQAMLDAQAKEARSRGVLTREDLFSTLDFPKVVDGDEDDVDSYSELKRYQRAKDSTVAELLRQQGTRQVRTTMIAKAIALAQYAKLTVLTALGHRKPCNPHSTAYTRQQHLSFFLMTLLAQRLRNYIFPVLRRSVRSQVVQGGTAALSSQLMEKRAPQLTSAVMREFAGGAKGGGGGGTTMGANLRIQPQRFGPTPKAQTVMHDTVSSKGANLKARIHDVDALGVIDLWNTPDGKNMGLENHSPLGARVRAGLFKAEIQVMLRGLFQATGGVHSLAPDFDAGDKAFIRSTRNVDFLVTETVMGRAIQQLTAGGAMRTLLRVNRAIVGWVGVPRQAALEEVLAARAAGQLHWEVSVFPCELGVEVECEAGTSLRPIVWLPKLRDLLLLFEEARRAPRLWSEEALLLAARARGAVSYLSPLEIQHRALVVAHDLHDLRSRRAAMRAKGTPFVAMELHPFLVHFGVTLGRIPFPQMGAAPRLTFPGMMIPQAAHMNRNASALRQSTTIAHTQRMLVETLAAKAFEPLLFTNSCVILVWAVAECQDDAWILNKSSVERGLLSVTQRCVYTTTNNSNYRVVGSAMLARTTRLQRLMDGDRSKLDRFGVIKRGAKVYPNDTILFQRACTRKDSNGMVTMFQDASVQHTRTTSVEDVWTVDKVVHGTADNGHRFEVHLARYVPPEVGDKFATPFGQKATVSAIWDMVDMPFCADGDMAGVAPDIIMNTLAYSRMTVNNAVMIQAGTVAADRGRILDGTPYEPFDIRALEAASRRMGHQPGGKVLMRDGRSGELIGDVRGDGQLDEACYMAMGVVPLMRLPKHTPRTVIQACGHTTRRSATTGQPLKGRGQDGSAMRYGGLVRNAITAHGAPDINHDAVQRANMSSYPICGACGKVNPSAPYDYINMAATKAVQATGLLQEMVDDCEVCVYCRKPAVRETELPMVMQLISEITSALNMTLEYGIKPKPGQYIKKVIDATRREFLSKLNADEFFQLSPQKEAELAELAQQPQLATASTRDAAAPRPTGAPGLGAGAAAGAGAEAGIDDGDVTMS